MIFGPPFGGKAGRSAAWAVAFGAAALDIFFLLVLALGVLPAEAHREREIPVELTAVAEGTSPVRVSAREVVIHVGATGDIRVGGNLVEVAWLERRLDQLVREAKGTAVTVRADARAPYGLVARILAASRKAGIRDASLLTVKPPASLAPPLDRP